MTSRPALFLHIGMSKVGSSSIQRSLIRNRKALKRQGIIWPEEVQERGGNYDTLAKSAMGKISPRFLKAFASFLERRSQLTVAVSSEFLWNLDKEMISLIHERVRDRQVQIAIYLRPYQDWIRAKYMQHARARRGTSDFDSFFERSATSISIRSNVTNWADAFGRDTLHIRHVESLPKRDVVADFMRLIGAETWQEVRSNPSPHWLVCELARSMFLNEPDRGLLYEKKGVNRRFMAELDRLTRKLDVPPARYLTNMQWQEISQVYRSDAEWLADYAGVPLPEFSDPPTVERPFLPQIAAAPPEFLKLLERRLANSEILAEEQYLAETIQRVLQSIHTVESRRA